MDQETLINIVLVVLFLLITTLVRAFKARQLKPRPKGKETKKTEQAAKSSPFAFFQKIRDQIQESLEELERQVRQERQKQEPESSDTIFWDDLAEDEDIQEESEKPPARETKHAYTRDQAEDPIQQMAIDAQVQGRGIRTPSSSEEVPPPTLHPYGRRPSLRQAVVWAEIIGKPVALKKNPYEHTIV